MTLEELIHITLPYFSPPILNSEESIEALSEIRTEQTPEIIACFQEFFDIGFSEDSFKQVTKNISKKLKLKKGLILKHLRYAVTGRKQGTDLKKFITIVPDQELQERIKKALVFVNK